ncbi:MAG TPA: hypothetical protein VII16_06650 [Actinomycetes bacterium]
MDGPCLTLVSRGRSQPLTDAETVWLGRILTRTLAVHQVSYPWDTPTVIVQLHDFAGPLPEGVVEKVAAVIGPFDEVLQQRPDGQG